MSRRRFLGAASGGALALVAPGLALPASLPVTSAAPRLVEFVPVDESGEVRVFVRRGILETHPNGGLGECDLGEMHSGWEGSWTGARDLMEEDGFDSRLLRSTAGEFLALQAGSPGRASRPVRADGSYRFKVARGFTSPTSTGWGRYHLACWLVDA